MEDTARTCTINGSSVSCDDCILEYKKSLKDPNRKHECDARSYFAIMEAGRKSVTISAIKE